MFLFFFLATQNQQPPGVPPKTGSKVFKVPSPTPSQRVVGNVSPVTSEVASKISVSPVVPQMATEPINNRFAPQEGIPDVVATHPPAPVARVPPNNERSVPVQSGTPTMTSNTITAPPGSRGFANQQHGKVSYQVNATQKSPTSAPPAAPPKKQIPLGRGAPPPVPPNKPVLSPHQILQKKESLTKGLTTNKTEAENVHPAAVEVTDTKLSSGGVDSNLADSSSLVKQVMISATMAATASANSESVACDSTSVLNITTNVSSKSLSLQPSDEENSCLSQNHSLDILGQEYADFQQLLVSMVSGKS